MAFFGYDYDPFDFFNYEHPYDPYHDYGRRRRPARTRAAEGFFPAAEPVAARPRRKKSEVFFGPGDAHPAPAPATARPRRKKSECFDVPVFGPDDAKPAPAPAPVNVTKIEKPAVPAEEAAARIQAAARGLLARKAVRVLRAVEREAAEVGAKVLQDAEALRGNARARIGLGEQLMKLLLRTDAVRGAREYRRRVARRVLALQDAVDALEQKPEDSGAGAAEVTAVSAVTEAAVESDTETKAADKAAVESETETKAADQAAVESETEAKATVAMEVDGGGEEEADETEQAAVEPEQAAHGADSADAEGDWEMVTEEPEPAPAAEVEVSAEMPRQEEAAGEEARMAEPAGGDGLDAKKLMEMVAALCEQNAKQCAVIGALAERVGALESAVRRVEDAERRRRQAKKLKKEGKGVNQNILHESARGR